MLRIAVQSKGRLFEETMALLQEADIKISTSKRILLVQSSNFPIEVLFLRDDDIPQSVAGGVADLGIVGENEFVERKEDAEVIKRLGFSKCRLSLAIPKYKDYVFPFYEIAQGKIVSITVSMSNDPGMLSSILRAIADSNGSILTINQDIPLQGIANVTIAFETKDLSTSLEECLDNIRSIRGILKVEILGQA